MKVASQATSDISHVFSLNGLTERKMPGKNVDKF